VNYVWAVFSLVCVFFFLVVFYCELDSFRNGDCEPQYDIGGLEIDFISSVSLFCIS
jgi:hypothetical protein